MTQIKKAIIIGTGPAGLAAALQLSRNNGILCHIYEIRSEVTTLGGAIGIPSNGVRLLDRLGAYGALETRASMKSTFTFRSQNGGILGSSDRVAWSREQTGFGYMRVKRLDLIEVLIELVRKQGIHIQFSKQIESIEETDQQISVTFSDGTSDTADILLGCDGIHSKVRTLYVDKDITQHYSGISSIGSIISKSSLPASNLSLESPNITITSKGMFAVMPCTASGDELYWFFSREVPIPSSGDTRDGWEEHGRQEVEKSKSILFNLLRDVSGEWGDLLRAMITETKVVKFYPVFKLPLGVKWHRGRCLLLGDAGHAMAPHVGQGTSMALEDAFFLSRLLKETSLPLSDIFQKFDETRRPRIENFYKEATHRADMRKDTGSWGLWLKESVLWVALKISTIFGLDQWGLDQTPLVYDIETVPI